jgi:hypothetical protein
MRTALDVCSAALVLIGAEPIASLEEGSAEAVACSHLYEPCVADLLTAHRWRFAAGQVELARLADPPEARWAAAYQLPPDLLDLHTVTADDRPISYQRYGETILCEADATTELVADGTFRVAEAVWPAYFAMVVQLRLAGQLALSIGAQQDMAVSLEGQAAVALARARHLDAAAHTSRTLGRGRLVAGRRRGWGVGPEHVDWYWR